MNCREFRRNHDAYIDDTLSAIELDAMAAHRERCERCARLDTRVRRALLLAHNLPPIHPSASFAGRLEARLLKERQLTGVGGRSRPLAGDRATPGFSASTYAAVAAGILAVAGLAATATVAGRPSGPIRLAPVVASLPEPEPSTLATPAMVASVPTGMALWPAVFAAQQAPWHLASDVVQR